MPLLNIPHLKTSTFDVPVLPSIQSFVATSNNTSSLFCSSSTVLVIKTTSSAGNKQIERMLIHRLNVVC